MFLFSAGCFTRNVHVNRLSCIALQLGQWDGMTEIIANDAVNIASSASELQRTDSDSL